MSTVILVTDDALRIEAGKQVAAGAAEMDNRLPDWWTGIDRVSLDLGNSYDCVLGQLFDEFEIGLELLGLNLGESERLGLYCSGDSLSQAVRDAYQLRTQLWIAEIDMREAAQALEV
ncbi:MULTISPECIES: hypothetical protein [Streptosporangium]|uniref:STAS domain-containing protein n=1 Tax=Streptosporangium brasiliense TaxID=47480 RepID=A0ABT9RM25_9ACTN|nr:hypothetical protein [Streptosporangium brasiliense]MDP9870346.1 hypothetical protein [Streptosporangium brasiliense]